VNLPYVGHPAYAVHLPLQHNVDASSWYGHIPFARWLVERTKPRSIVELGVFQGGSYLAFCQAVKQLRLNARCVGVDTWKGDAFTGPYDGIFPVLADAHQQYAVFSSLLRMTFDEASYSVSPDIDILHIDGLHTYDAVKHDFRVWIGKMSDYGIILLHDTQVNHPDFGVSQFFEEVKIMRPTFEFHHCAGLGVVAAGSHVDVPELFNANPTQAQEIREYFANGAKL
jgi:hypothetical protein